MSVKITLRSLAEQAGVSYVSLCYDVKNKIFLNPEWDGNNYMVSVDDPMVQLILKDPDKYRKLRNFKNKHFHQVAYQNKKYATVTDLARALNVSRETVYRMIEKGEVISLKKTY